MPDLTAARSGSLVAAAVVGFLLPAIAPAWAATYSLVYAFNGGNDGESPYDSLVDVGGKLYGTTFYGGGSCGCGTVYSITTAGAEKIVYSMGANTAYPESGLINVGGTLYGTTTAGGTTGNGAIYSVTPAGSEKLVYSFAGGNLASSPMASPNNVNGTLYGTTYGGGDDNNCGFYGCGAAYAVTTAGVWNWFYFFQSGNGDGQNPESHLYKVGGKLYGTTRFGGATGNGAVFSITTAGDEKVIYSFKGGSDGEEPQSSLVDVGGTLYGTTQEGGGGGANYCGNPPFGCGTVYSITTAGVEKVLYAFKGGSDGASPLSGLLNVNGTLYGMTNSGGKTSCSNPPSGCGTVYSITTAGVEKVLYAFKGGSDGAYPTGNLINVGGTLWGTTNGGGPGTGCSDIPAGCGTVFKLKP
jgi:uncharacterized repeat protein (TIGR03803 family)